MEKTTARERCMKDLRRFESILDVIGWTPIVRLNRIMDDLPVEVWAKLEFLNPMGSVKDRIARYMIEKAEREGRIEDGALIIENSSGNTALGLAMVAIQKGYRLKVVVRDRISPEKDRQLRALGVEVHKVDSSPSSRIARFVQQDHAPARRRDAWAASSPTSTTTGRTTRRTTSPPARRSGSRWRGASITWWPVWARAAPSAVRRSSSRRKTPPSRWLPWTRRVRSSTTTSAPANASSRSPTSWKVWGTSSSSARPILSVIDDMIRVSDRDAFLTTRELVRREGIMGGGSSGAVVWAIRQLARDLNRPAQNRHHIPRRRLALPQHHLRRRLDAAARVFMRAALRRSRD